MLLLLLLQLIAFTVPPLYFTTLVGPLRRVHFYVYIAIVLMIGGFMGNVYSLSLPGGITVSGGNLCYGAFMMAAVMFVWVEKDAFILRHLVRLVVLVDIFNIVISFLTQEILSSEHVINPHGAPAAIFEVSTALIALGGALIISELLLLFFIFESVKARKPSLPVTAVIYTLSFILVLVLDGIAFPFIAFGISAPIVSIVFGGISGKIFMAAAFSLPLATFMFWRRKAFLDYLQSDTIRWRLLATSSAELIREMSRKDQAVRRGDIVFRNSAEGLAIVDKAGKVLKSNAAFRKMLSLKDKAADDGPISLCNLFRGAEGPVALPTELSDEWRREVLFGQDLRHPGVLAITPAGDDPERGATFVYSLTDITEQKAAQEQLEHLALHDQLTGLPNRRMLDRSLAALGEASYTFAIIDIDHFKDVNDSYGHEIGDVVLQEIAGRLSRVRETRLGPDDVLCRIGGDEFAFLIHSSDVAFVDSVLDEIHRELSRILQIGDSLEILSSATIGISRSSDEKRRDALLEADAALYEAKRNRRGSIGVYEERLTSESQKKMAIGLKLKHALADRTLDVYYQPQFDATSRKVRGVEALVRWTDPELGTVSPGEFIPIAEATGLIEALGEYVLEKACRDGQAWIEQGYAPVTVSVNVSASQLRFGRFTETLPDVLAKTRFPAERLEIEVTESSYIEREGEVTPILLKLMEMGISVAIDDFGTGYSSLSYLRDMPWSCLKIDRSFIVDLLTDEKQRSVTLAIIRLARAMSFKVVAEGVETKEQLDFLAVEGCDLIQGFYLARPMAGADVVKIFDLNAPVGKPSSDGGGLKATASGL